MALSDRSAIDRAIGELFQAEKTAQTLRTEIATSASGLVLDAITDAIGAARRHGDEETRVVELVALVSILGRLDGPRAVDALIDILGSEEPEGRHAAGMALEELAYERFKEVAVGIERALGALPAEHLALTELPYLLVEVPEPGVTKLLTRFLEHANGDVVAAALEAFVELGDPSAVRAIARLENDQRMVELDDEESEGEIGTLTIGELAKEARQLLEADGPEDDA